MFYTMYLAGVCSRRQWPEPRYSTFEDRKGYQCVVRVNNREYCTEVAYETPQLAQESAATKAYMICRNFSANDGMFPGQRPGQRSSNGHVQGLPVAIGSGRRAHRDSSASYDTGSSEGTSSGGNSPRGVESSFEQQMMRTDPRVHVPVSHRNGRIQHGQPSCYCGRAPAGRCFHCVQDRTWS